MIYNRLGQLVFQTNDINNGWDGTFKGKALNTAVFMAHLKTTFYDGEESILYGDISLIK